MNLGTWKLNDQERPGSSSYLIIFLNSSETVFVRPTFVMIGGGAKLDTELPGGSNRLNFFIFVVLFSFLISFGI